jgi:hypothetical protein
MGEPSNILGGPTFAPLRASSIDKPAPIPRDAPVTMATLPCKGSAAFDVVDMVREFVLCLCKFAGKDGNPKGCRFPLDI